MFNQLKKRGSILTGHNKKEQINNRRKYLLRQRQQIILQQQKLQQQMIIKKKLEIEKINKQNAILKNTRKLELDNTLLTSSNFDKLNKYNEVNNLNEFYNIYFKNNSILKIKFEEMLKKAKQFGVNLVLSKNNSRFWNYYDNVYFNFIKLFTNIGVTEINIVENFKFDESLNINLLINCNKNEKIPVNTVLLMGEQIGVNDWEYSKDFLEKYKNLIKKSMLVINYSLFQSLNFNDILKINNILYMPFTLREGKLDENIEILEKEYDICFMGWTTDYRKDILNSLGLKFKIKFLNSFDNNFIIKTINKSKIFLNIHKNTIGKDIELARLCQGIGGSTIVISEFVNDKFMENIFKDIVIFCDKNNMIKISEKILSDEVYRNNLLKKNNNSYLQFKYNITNLLNIMNQENTKSKTRIIHLLTSNTGNFEPNFKTNSVKEKNLNLNSNQIKVYSYKYIDNLNNSKIDDKFNYRQCELCMGMSNRLRAKYYKFQAHKLKLHRYADYLIWIDSSFIVTDNNKFFNFLLSEIEDNDLMIFKHRGRNCIYDEGNYCIQMYMKGVEYIKSRYNPNIINKQLKDYDLDEYPRNNGLYELGLIIRKNNVKVNKFFDDVWMECIKYGSNDQIPFPFCLRKYSNELKIKVFDRFNVYQGHQNGFIHSRG